MLRLCSMLLLVTVIFQMDVAADDQPSPQMVVVASDAGAGGYEAFPDVCRLRDGRLMCVYYAGYGHVSLPNAKYPRGGRIAYSLSEDEGRTWSDPQTLHDGPFDDRDPSITQLKDGRLMCSYFAMTGTATDYNGTLIVTSKDAGRSWSQPQRIAEKHGCSSPVRELADGRLILGVYSENAKEDVASGVVTFSDDDGGNWTPPIVIDNAGAYLDAETDIIELKDGSLYAALRGGKGAQMHWSISKDRGRTWSVSRPIGFDGHCPYLHRAAGDIILLGHRLPKTSLHYSLDECRTWSDNVLVDEGTSGAYPSLVDLADGSVLVVYYEEGRGANIRARRLRATKNGIEWLRFD